ncbi:hypothetical protein KLA_13856 [Cellulophaga geojensis KL-A]|uniref:Peptidase M56 domain-containing protein n=1 Tax=Cellulophaga geojensis KL-A TaxID=1328323 RepID=A0ABP3B441_9FLAO|nr:hypothetical protein KLA_13856 [Cellulophaga geojensis KL-A]
MWPFIILKSDALRDDDSLINHEKIHLRQQLELLVLPFYIVYLFEFLIRCLFYWDSYRAYQNLSFEREAYFNEDNPNYLNERKPFSFIKYLWR